MLQHKAVAYDGLRNIAVNHFVISGFAIRLNEAQTSWACSGPEEVVVSGLLPDNGLFGSYPTSELGDWIVSQSPTVRPGLGVGTSNDSAFSGKLT